MDKDLTKGTPLLMTRKDNSKEDFNSRVLHLKATSSPTMAIAKGMVGSMTM